LRANDQDHLPRAAGVCRQLAAGRRDGDQGAFFGNGGDAAHHEIWSCPQAADLVALRLAVECPHAWLYGDEAVGVIDVGLDTRPAQRLAGGGKNRCCIGQQGSHSNAGRVRIVKNFDAECTSGKRSGGAVDLPGSGRRGELLPRVCLG